MDFKDFTAGQNDDERRLDRVLRKFLTDKNLSEIYKLLRKGLIKVKHTKAKPENHIKNGDVISIASFLISDSDISAGPANSVSTTANSASVNTSNLEIVFENQHLLIINKPYDRTVHGEKDGLYKDVLSYYESHKTAESASLSFKPGPLHRLDRRTTGLLVFSKSIEGARWFTKGIQNHTIQKSYYALIEGKLEKKEEWQDYITDEENDDKNAFHKVRATTIKNSVNSKNSFALAVSFVTPLAYGQYKGKNVTLAEFQIKTGRKHQIRSQSALHKHPLLGDTAYGAAPTKNAGPSISTVPAREFYLQAYKLTFPKDNPLGLPNEIKIGLSPDFLEQLQCCEIENPEL